MKIKTAEATNTQLNYLVAKADGCEWLYEDLKAPPPPGADYTTDWAQGGPIIEREYIELTTTNRSNAEIWEAMFPGRGQDSPTAYGPTPLIAAMRCYVASKLGDEVEIPEELK